MAYTKFNEKLEEFLGQLVVVFPEVPQLSAYKTIAANLIKTNPENPAQLFLSTTAPHSFKIIQNDPTFFDDCPNLLKIDIKSLWNKPDLS